MLKELAKGIAMRLAIRAVIAVVGLGAVLLYWTFSGNHKSGSSTSASKIPAKILGGGGQRVIVDVDTNAPARLAFMGDLPRKPNGDQSTEEDTEQFTPGHHTWAVELGPKATGTFFLESINPQVGAQLSWKITVDGKQLADESQTLDKPLQAGYAFGLQANVGRDEEEEQPSDSSGSHQ